MLVHMLATGGEHYCTFWISIWLWNYCTILLLEVLQHDSLRPTPKRVQRTYCHCSCTLLEWHARLSTAEKWFCFNHWNLKRVYKFTVPNSRSFTRLHFKASSSAQKKQKQKKSHSYPCICYIATILLIMHSQAGGRFCRLPPSCPSLPSVETRPRRRTKAKTF